MKIHYEFSEKDIKEALKLWFSEVHDKHIDEDKIKFVYTTSSGEEMDMSITNGLLARYDDPKVKEYGK